MGDMSFKITHDDLPPLDLRYTLFYLLSLSCTTIVVALVPPPSNRLMVLDTSLAIHVSKSVSLLARLDFR